MSDRRERSKEKIHLDHRQASREHAAWQKDIDNWRASYREALLSCARRLASHLELENFEDALDRHEAAIAAHEQAVHRHEKALRLGHEGEASASEDSLEFHRLMGLRHERSRATHDQLERSYRAIVAALEMLSHR